MLIRFTDDYVNYINAGYTLVGILQHKIATEEPYLGLHPALDSLYAYSTLTYAIIDALEHDDNSNPAENERLLRCLKSLLHRYHCPVKTNSIKMQERYPTNNTPPTIQNRPYIIEDTDPTYIVTENNERLIY